MRTISVFLFVATAVAMAYTQIATPQEASLSPGAPVLHLLAACPTPKQGIGFEAEIYRVDERSKDITLVRKIGTREGGVDFVLTDYDKGIIAIASPRLTPTRLDLVHMNAAATPDYRQLNISDISGATWTPWPGTVRTGLQSAGLRPGRAPSLLGRMLLERSGKGRWLGLRLASDAGVTIMGIPLTDTDPSARREFLLPAELSGIRVTGTFGTANTGLARLGDSDVQGVRVEQRRVFLPVTDDRVDLSLIAPTISGIPNDTWSLVTRNDQLTVLLRNRDPEGSSVGDGVGTLHVFTGGWSSYRVPGSQPCVKSIGSWIIGVAASDRLGRESPGNTERRRRQPSLRESRDGGLGRPVTETRPQTEDYFRDSRQYYPGILFLIDTTTGRTFQIRTDQADSEILFVHENLVYYRINNRLLAAQIQGTAIGPGQVLAENDALADVHWAFMGY